jgi:hypothetical protein
VCIVKCMQEEHGRQAENMESPPPNPLTRAGDFGPSAAWVEARLHPVRATHGRRFLAAVYRSLDELFTERGRTLRNRQGLT